MEIRERGGCLSLWLIWNGLLLVGVIWLTFQSEISAISLIFSVFTGIIYLAAIVAAWNWKRWGIYVLLGFLIIGGIFQIIVIPSSATNSVVYTCVQLAVYYGLLRYKWHLFE